VATGRELANLPGFERMYAVTMSPNGKEFVVWGKDSEIVVYDMAGNTLRSISDDRTIHCFALSSDGELAALGDNGGSVRIWNTAKRERVGGDLPAHAGISDLVISPDKKLLITGGTDGEARIWNLGDRKMVRSFKAHEQRIMAFAISGDGKRFA